MLIPSANLAHLLCCAGNIAAWKKKEGDEVAAGDSFAEIETDKVRWALLLITLGS